MKAPQIIWIVLVGIILFWTAYKHGQPKEGKYNFWEQIVSTILTVALLYWGGFF